MFKMVKTINRLEWPVKVQVPADGGKTDTHEFTAVFKLLPQAEYDKLLRTAEDDAAMLGELVQGWHGLTDEAGEELEYSLDVIKELCQYPFIRTAIFRAYGEAASGVASKN
ncbi:hypothetical protein IT774_05150 [Salinimonas marina]|uniref:Tail assembly chaperone n=1 Tax=Salinimonas marina TaxID=2785918 RepID=A0A7S9HDS0_9ALTE|nr:hypothetical protein [Salinimonas marina]QPG06561.1 hypothetical protein IT774_05150 [Salinimonas marina]